jgi:hypothetical protein
MIRIVVACLMLIAVFTQAACVVVPAGRRSGAVAATPACHPSQYWDGTQCRHKGQGRGARKHDGY